MTSDPWLVVGLGNPGPGYLGTRHNVGAAVLAELAGRAGARLAPHKGRADVAAGVLAGTRVLLARPRSYMNECGPAVAAVRSFYRVPIERVVVVHDDMDVPFDELRVKRGGGDAGHNGLRSVSAALGSRDYLRVRVGIGRPPGRMDPADFVLARFAPAERKALPGHVARSADAVADLLVDPLDVVQNRYHGAPG